MINAKLVMLGKQDKPIVIKLKKLPMTIGRGRDADVTLAHPMASRLHCEFYNVEDTLCVRDLGSLNGTFIGDVRITEAALESGDELTIGTAKFEVVIGADEDQPIMPPAPMQEESEENAREKSGAETGAKTAADSFLDLDEFDVAAEPLSDIQGRALNVKDAAAQHDALDADEAEPVIFDAIPASPPTAAIDAEEPVIEEFAAAADPPHEAIEELAEAELDPDAETDSAPASKVQPSKVQPSKVQPSNVQVSNVQVSDGKPAVRDVPPQPSVPQPKSAERTAPRTKPTVPPEPQKKPTATKKPDPPASPADPAPAPTTKPVASDKKGGQEKKSPQPAKVDTQGLVPGADDDRIVIENDDDDLQDFLAGLK